MPPTQANTLSQSCSPAVQRRRTNNRISDERRERIVRMRLNNRYSFRQIAQEEGLCISTVSSIVSRFQKTSRLVKTQRGGSTRRSKLGNDHIHHVQQYWRRRPLSTLKDARNDLLSRYPDIGTLSVSTLQRAIASKGTFTLKRVHRDLPARNSTPTKRKRQAWCAEWLSQLVIDKAIYIDESGFNLATARQYGWSEQGNRAIATRPSQGANLTLIVAVSVEKQVIAHQERFGSTDTAVFESFIHNLLAKLHQPHQIVMDNASIHKNIDIKNAIQNAGHTLIFQPPYTPEFNLCEWVFGLVKGYVGKQEIDTHGTLIDHITSKLDNITEADMRGFMAESIRWTKAAQFSKDLGIQHDADHFETAEMEDWSDTGEGIDQGAGDMQDSSNTASSEDLMSLA